LKVGNKVRVICPWGNEKLVLAVGVIVKISGNKVYIRCFSKKGIEIEPWYPINFVELRD
jgi:hypothetical protein